MDIHSVLPIIKTQLLYVAALDPEGTTVLGFLLLIFLMFSFVVSGSEVAFFSLTHKDINFLKTKQQPAYERILDMLEAPKLLLAALLIANSFANIAIIIISNLLLDNVFQFQHIDIPGVEFLIKIVAVVSLLLLFCEMIPKVYANHNNIRFAKDFGLITEGVYYLFKGMGSWLVKYSDVIEKKLSRKINSAYSLEELDQAIDITTHNTASDKEKNILKGIVKFGNITVKEVMRARLDVSGIDYNSSFSELIQNTEELHYSRLPVYKEDLDNIAGVINTKDILPLLDHTSSFDWHSLIRPPYFVHEQKMIEDLLKEFQSKHVHFAIVVDEFGGTSGIVTLEDILEEIIGDIKDEFDEEDSIFRKLDENNYIFEGRTMINDVCKFMDLPGDTFDSVKGESNSLAGLVLELAGEIPNSNQTIQSGDFEFTVLEVQKHYLEKIKVSIKPVIEST